MSLTRKDLLKHQPLRKNSQILLQNLFTRGIPHCLGSINGKDIIIQAPPKKGSTFFNYKKSFSIVSLIVCNTNCLHFLILVKLAGKVMEVSTTTVN